MTQAEAKQGDNYMPDVNNAAFAGKTFQRKSAPSGVSDHATGVGDTFYGAGSPPLSLAKDITVIDVYYAFDWYMFGCLNATTTSAPLTEVRRIENHSWIADGDATWASDVLRRVDLLADRDGVVVVAAANNGAGAAMPQVLASAYNVLTVGLTDGQSSYGPTTVENPGRVKPDIVAPANETSLGHPDGQFSRGPAASDRGCQQHPIRSPPPPSSARERPCWSRPCFWLALPRRSSPIGARGLPRPVSTVRCRWTIVTVPASLNIDNSHRILTAGRQQPSSSADVGLTGWDYGNITSGSTVRYFFQVPAGQYVRSLSILATWSRHVKIVNDKSGFSLVPSLANIDLRLFQASGYTSASQVDQSVSALDNVEHIYQTGLGCGRYVFQLTSDQSWPYAIAWDVTPAAAIAGDVDHDGHVDVTDLLIFLDSWALLVGDPNFDPNCDFNGDGSVDVIDLLMMVDNWGT